MPGRLGTRVFEPYYREKVYVRIFCHFAGNVPGEELQMLPISSLVRFKRGDHICIFYRSEPFLLQNLVPYLASGLRQGERCFCVQKPHLLPLILAALAALGFDPEHELRRGALDLHRDEEFYFSGGRFAPQALMDALERSIDEAIAKGFTGTRTAGELTCALERGPGSPALLCDQVVGYEKMVERGFSGKAAIGICQYDAQLFPPQVQQQVLESHRWAIQEAMAGVNHSTLTLRSGEFMADIVTDRVYPGEAFHYVVQRRGNPEVLSWGRESSIGAAILSSENVIAELSSNRRIGQA